MNLTPEQQQELWEFMQNLKSNPSIPFDVAEAFKSRLGIDLPDELSNAPVANIGDPAGGGTIDSQARTTVGLILDALVTLGLMES